MPRIRFKAFQTSQLPDGSNLLDRILQELQDSFEQVGDLVTNEKIVTATLAGPGIDNEVRHGLGYPFSTWELVDKNAQADVWQSPATNITRNLGIFLRASANVTVKVRFT